MDRGPPALIPKWYYAALSLGSDVVRPAPGSLPVLGKMLVIVGGGWGFEVI